MNKGRREGQGERANNNKEFSYVFVWCLFRSLIGPKSGQNPKKKKHPNLQPHRGNSLSYFQEAVPMIELESPYVVETVSGNYHFPQNFGDQLRQALINQTGVEDVTLRCALFNMITANIEPDDAAVGELSSPVSGVTVRFIREESFGFSLSPEIVLDDLEDVILELFVPNPTCDSRRRFSLTTKDEETNYQPTFYEGDGEFTLQGVTFINQTCSSVFFSVSHFSNFGLLFGGTSSQENWTTLRIISVALIGGIWASLLVFFGLVSYSQTVRRKLKVEASVERDLRVMGQIDQ